MALIKTIDDACDFILKWTGFSEDLAGSALSRDQPYPDCVETLNRRLGQLWSKVDRSFILHGLFNVQDEIIDPRRYEMTVDGAIKAVWENQGVWGYAFRPNALGLLVCGAWCDIGPSEFDPAWRAVDASLEDALVSVLLANFCLAFHNEGDGLPDDPKPEDADTLLWMHPAWNGFFTFDGFWTNAHRTMIHYGGMGFTARQLA